MKRKGSGTRLFEIVAERVRAAKTRASGERLQPVQELARDFGVSKATMNKALNVLSSKGLLESFRGKGTFWIGGESRFDGKRTALQGSALVSLSDKLRGRILDGTYRVGQALPKVNFISLEERVSPDTVCAALKVLSKENLIWKRGKSWMAGRSGTGVSQKLPAARGNLRATPVILLLVPDYSFWDKVYHDEHPGKFVQNFYLEIERMGLETHLATIDSSASGFFSGGRQRIQALVESLGDRYLGVMYVSRDADPDWLSWLGRFKRPVVWLDLECLVKDMDMRTIPGGKRLFRCLKDEEASVALALDTLAALGHRRIGFPVLRSPEFPWIPHRLAILRARAAAYDPPLTIVESEHRESFWHPKPWLGPEDFRGWLAKPPKSAKAARTGGAGLGGDDGKAAAAAENKRTSGLGDIKTLRRRNSLSEKIPSLMELFEAQGVTAIIAPNDYFGHQYYLWFREMDVKVPGDVSLLSFDNNHYSRPFSISSIDFGFSDLSYQVAHIFLGDIPVKADRRHNLFSRPVLMGRDTIGFAPKKSGGRPGGGRA